MDEKANKLLEQYKTQGPLTTGQIGDVIGSTPNNATITASSLQPEQPIQLPQSKVSTVANGISGTTSALLELDQVQQQAAKEAADRQAKLQETENKQSSLLERIGLAKKDITTQGRQEFGLDTLEPTRRKALQDLRTAQVKQLEEIKGLDTANMTDAGRMAAESEIKRKYGMDQLQAQLSYYIANDNITAAEKTIGDRIALETDPLYAQLDLTQKVYDQISDRLGESEGRVWEAKIASINKKIKDTEDVGNFAKEVAKNGAPADVINRVAGAKSIAEAAGIAGIYAGDILERQKKQLEIQKLNKEIQALGVPTITNPEANKYSGALNTILGSGTFTKDQKATIVNAVNNGQDPFSVIKNQAKNIMGQTLATDLDKSETALSQIRSIDSLLTQYYANGGSTGVFSGNYEKVINKLGQVNDPKLVGIATEIALAMQSYRLAVTGTAASVKEDSKIENIFPGINTSEGLNKARTGALEKSFQQKIDASYRNTLGSSYDTLKQAETTQKAQDANVPYKVVPQTQVPEGYYQASDGLFYKKQ